MLEGHALIARRLFGASAKKPTTPTYLPFWPTVTSRVLPSLSRSASSGGSAVGGGRRRCRSRGSFGERLAGFGEALDEQDLGLGVFFEVGEDARGASRRSA